MSPRPVGGKYPTTPGGKGWAPSVTTIVGLMDKPGLPWGAAGETALFAIHHQDEWTDLSPEDAYDRLRKHHKGVWNDKAAKGTLVHDFAHAWSRGEDVECPPHCEPYLDALERFYAEQQPITLHAEEWVAYDDENLGYGGSFDRIDLFSAGPHAGKTGIVDIKTGKRYPIEATVQLAAYRFSDGIAVKHPAGGIESIQPLPAIDFAAILYLHDDGTYELLEVPADERAFDVFLHLRAQWSWLADMRAWERKNPAPEPREAVKS